MIVYRLINNQLTIELETRLPWPSLLETIKFRTGTASNWAGISTKR